MPAETRAPAIPPKLGPEETGGDTFGADSGARSKDDDVPAVRIEEAIRALLAGEVETARRLLR